MIKIFTYLHSWFSNLEILEIHQEVYWQIYQQIPNTVAEKLNTGKTETHNQNQTLNDNSGNTTNTKTHALTHEEKMNVGIMKRIIYEKETTLPSLRN